MKLQCKCICNRFDKISPIRWYTITPNGCYCSRCAIAFVLDSNICPCCHGKVRRYTKEKKIDRRVYID